MSSAASAALFSAWAYQWVGIISLGLLPVLLQPSLGRYTWFWRTKSLCSLGGLLLCIMSGPILLDTFAVESGKAAVEQAPCRISELPAHRWARLHCEDGATYRVEGYLKANEGQSYTLHYLPNSRIVVEAVMVK